MISALRLTAEIRNKLNRVNSNYDQTIKQAQLDLFATEAYHVWFKNKAKVFKEQGLRDLIDYEVKRYKLTPVRVDSTSFFVSYPPDLYKCTRRLALAKRDNCSLRSLIIHPVESDDLDEALRSSDISPSFDYEETIGNEGRGGMYVFVSDFEITSVEIDYLKKPGDIKTPSLAPDGYYIDPDGNNVTQDSGVESDSAMQYHEIADLAVLFALNALSDFPEFQNRLNEILSKQRQL